MAPTAAPARERILDAAQDLVLRHGFSATTVDAILAAAGTSKGAFFHHFPSKATLGRALVERYAAADAELLDQALTAAEASTDDPADQLLALLDGFAAAVDEQAATPPACLFVSFVYEQIPDAEGTRDVVVEAIELWRARLLAKLEEAAAAHPPARPVDLPSLADQVFTTFEGSFILARATDDPGHVRAQLRHLRTYLALLFGRP